MGIGKHGLFRVRLEKWPIASPLSVAIFLLILKLFLLLSSCRNVTSKPLRSRGTLFAHLSVFRRREQKVLLLIVSYRYTLMAGA